MLLTIKTVYGDRYADVHPLQVDKFSLHGWAFVSSAETGVIYSIHKVLD